jgi:EAL domain-containing protein (putative c-di-GMP-specific phosphodiesterase class I)
LRCSLARGIIGLGHSLGLHIIGEGVETEAQLRFLQDEGYDFVQGFYFSAALSFEDLVAWKKSA